MKLSNRKWRMDDVEKYYSDEVESEYENHLICAMNKIRDNKSYSTRPYRTESLERMEKTVQVILIVKTIQFLLKIIQFLFNFFMSWSIKAKNFKDKPVTIEPVEVVAEESELEKKVRQELYEEFPDITE